MKNTQKRKNHQKQYYEIFFFYKIALKRKNFIILFLVIFAFLCVFHFLIIHNDGKYLKLVSSFDSRQSSQLRRGLYWTDL
jgi:hypothetical protein